MGTHATDQSIKQNYCGRFAPSPTGPLHYGSLIAAVASYLQAKHHHGKWLVRIEDIDPPREVQGAADEILHTLERFGFEWHQSPLFQSTRYLEYRQAINRLKGKGLLYACSCSRKQIKATAKQTILGKRYPGICRTKNLDVFNTEYNLRLRTSSEIIYFSDKVFGKQAKNLANEVGDFIVYRKFDLPTYALAVTIDDAYQGITEVVRGYDLLAFTPLQIYLCQTLGLPIPKFLHIPMIINQHGAKLSKQSQAKALSTDHCSYELVQALNDLGQETPPQLAKEPIEQIWQWATGHWDATKIPRTQALPYYLS